MHYSSGSLTGPAYLASLHCHVMLLELPAHHAAGEAAQRARLLSWEARLPLLGAAAHRGALWLALVLVLVLLLGLGMLLQMRPLRHVHGSARRALGGPGHRGRLHSKLLLPAASDIPNRRRRSCQWVLRIRLPLLLGPGPCVGGCRVICISGQIYHWLLSCRRRRSSRSCC